MSTINPIISQIVAEEISDSALAVTLAEHDDSIEALADYLDQALYGQLSFYLPDQVVPFYQTIVGEPYAQLQIKETA